MEGDLVALTPRQRDEIAKKEILAKIKEFNQIGTPYTFSEIHHAFNGKYNLQSIRNITLHLEEKGIITPRFHNNRLVGYTINEGNRPCDECGSPTSLCFGIYVCENCGLEASPQYVPAKHHVTISGEHGDLGAQYVSAGERVEIIDGLGSYIGYCNTIPKLDGQDSPLPIATRQRYAKSKNIYHFLALIKNKESIFRVLRSLNGACILLKVTNTSKRRAAYLYRKALKLLSEDDFSTHPVLACACLHTAIKEHKEPHILKQVVDTFRTIGHKIAERSVFSALEALKRVNLRQHTTRQSSDVLPDLVSKLITHPEVTASLTHKKE